MPGRSPAQRVAEPACLTRGEIYRAVGGTAACGAGVDCAAGAAEGSAGELDSAGGTDPGAGGAAPAVGPGAVRSATSVFSASSSACFVMTTMLIRRLIGFCGSALSNRTEEDRPTTREILLSGRPAAVSARRAAFARSAESSQLV